MTLDELGLKYGTDKSSSGHNYLKSYEMFLESMRDKALTILEIGVWEGSSLKMWKEYFRSSVIIGVDIEDKKQYEDIRIATDRCDQSNAKDLIRIGEYYGLFDIITDDGSHHADHQILSFETLFPYLKSKGMYVIEDTLCSYDKERWGEKANVFDRIKQMVEEVNLSGKISNYHINADKEKQVEKYDNLTYFEKNVEWVHVGMGFCIVKKM